MQALADLGAKKHRAKKSGAKADKKKSNKKKKLGQNDARSNPRAFSVANVVRTKRTQQRNLDKAQQKEVVPLTNRQRKLPLLICLIRKSNLIVYFVMGMFS
jgi:ribosome biogenesis protein BMS1